MLCGGAAGGRGPHKAPEISEYSCQAFFAILDGNTPTPGHHEASPRKPHQTQKGRPVTQIMTDRELLEALDLKYPGLEEVGAAMAAKVCRRLRMSKADTEAISALTAQHMRFRNIKEMRASKLKRFLRQPVFAELLELHRLDCLASHGQLDLYEFCREKMAQAEPEELQPTRLLTGRDLIAMGFEPGVLFKEILTALEDEQLEGRLGDREEAVAWVRQGYGELLS